MLAAADYPCCFHCENIDGGSAHTGGHDRRCMRCIWDLADWVNEDEYIHSRYSVMVDFVEYIKKEHA